MSGVRNTTELKKLTTGLKFPSKTGDGGNFDSRRARSTPEFYGSAPIPIAKKKAAFSTKKAAFSTKKEAASSIKKVVKISLVKASTDKKRLQPLVSTTRSAMTSLKPSVEVESETTETPESHPDDIESKASKNILMKRKRALKMERSVKEITAYKHIYEEANAIVDNARRTCDSFKEVSNILKVAIANAESKEADVLLAYTATKDHKESTRQQYNKHVAKFKVKYTDWKTLTKRKDVPLQGIPV